MDLVTLGAAKADAKKNYAAQPTTVPLNDDTVRTDLTPSFTRIKNGMVTQAQSGLDSLYQPWLMRVDNKLSSPLGKYYLWYSTNHSGGLGGIGLAYANDPAGPWTVYNSSGPIYQDTTAAFQTENFSALWDSANNRFIGYYKAAAALQTYAATSPDGITWTRYGLVLPKLNDVPGGTLTGYFRPFKWGGIYRGYHLSGGGSNPFMSISHSYDGFTWVTDPRPLMYWCDLTGSNSRRIDWHYSAPFFYKGRLWLLGETSDFVSGGAYGNPQQFVAPLSSDLRSIEGAMTPTATTLLSGETVIGEVGNIIRGADGALYGAYVSGGDVSGVGGGSLALMKGV